MIAVKSTLFKPSRVLATPASLEAIEQAGQSVWEFLTRHFAGDWGNVDTHDKAASDEALRDGSRLLSAYVLNTGTTIWLITEAQDDNGHRVATTALLPDDY